MNVNGNTLIFSSIMLFFVIIVSFSHTAYAQYQPYPSERYAPYDPNIYADPYPTYDSEADNPYYDSETYQSFESHKNNTPYDYQRFAPYPYHHYDPYMDNPIHPLPKKEQKDEPIFMTPLFDN